MDQNTIAGALPLNPGDASADAQSSARSLADVSFWPSFLMAVALTSIAVGLIWDISWHETVGRDTFWTPAHMAIYLGGVLGGSVGGWLAIKHTFFAGPLERDSSVGVFGARAPLGAWVAIWGAIAMITSGPFDDWWHNAYGLDVKIISPPHVVLGLGMLGISVGALLLVLSRQNRLQETARDGSGLFIYTGGVFVLLGSVFILEYIFPNQQHGVRFYIVCGMVYPMRLIALSCAGRISWPATRVALVYMLFMAAMGWILPLFPAQPKLAPIFNPVTHMVPLPFPLLLVFPALAIDLVIHKTGVPERALERIGFAILLAFIFFTVLLAVQWTFSKFMLSPKANNWFFNGNRIWGYGNSPGEWRTQFWEREANRFTISRLGICFFATAASAWIGLFFGRWMKKVRR